VAINLNNLAQLLQATNRLSEAEPLMRRAFEIFLSSLGAHHPNTVKVRDNYISLLESIGCSAEEIKSRWEALGTEGIGHSRECSN
jgi:hypothetical protein